MKFIITHEWTNWAGEDCSVTDNYKTVDPSIATVVDVVDAPSALRAFIDKHVAGGEVKGRIVIEVRN